MNIITTTTGQERASEKLQALKNQVVAAQTQLEETRAELEAARAELKRKEEAAGSASRQGKKKQGQKRTRRAKQHD